MTTTLRPGSRWRSQVSTAEVIVVRATGEPGQLSCGGSPMVPADGTAPPDAGGDVPGQTQLGKRYSDPDDRVQVLCTKAGAGTLALDGVELAPQAARALPASD